ncbi:MAG: bifunctional nicotinamidase/pyrazinamidase [Thermoanaerobaculia bacterium]
MKRALILVDIQYDFLPGGALAVAEGDAVVPVVNRLQPQFDLVVATQDWHPPDHGSFASNHPGRKPGEMSELGGLPQVLWPDHCVQGTHGAELHRELDLRFVAEVFRKGTDPEIDSYSGFFDNGHRKATGLGDFLRDAGVTDVYLVGLATDYCVKWSALDAIQLGFATHVVEDGCRGVELKPGDVAAAIAEVRQAGAKIVRSAELIASLSEP